MKSHAIYVNPFSANFDRTEVWKWSGHLGRSSDIGGFDIKMALERELQCTDGFDRMLVRFSPLRFSRDSIRIVSRQELVSALEKCNVEHRTTNIVRPIIMNRLAATGSICLEQSVKLLSRSIRPEIGGQFREGPVCSGANHGNNYIRYREAPNIDRDIELLESQCNDIIKRSRPLAALVLWAGIQNIHPFADGNGGVARVMYNLIMTENDTCFLPLNVSNLLSKGSLTLRLREAEALGAWEELIISLIGAIKLFSQYNTLTNL